MTHLEEEYKNIRSVRIFPRNSERRLVLVNAREDRRDLVLLNRWE